MLWHPFIFCVSFAFIELFYCQTQIKDPPHGPDASFQDIVRHIMTDRNNTHLDQTPLTQEEQSALRAPNFTGIGQVGSGWTRRTNNPVPTYYLAAGISTAVPYEIYYDATKGDWDIRRGSS